MVGDFARGVADGVRGAAYLARRPRLWRWVIAPAAIAAVLLVIAIGGILGALGAPIAAVAAVLPGSWADNLIKIAATIVLAIASVSIFISLAALIAAPFNEMLSEAVEEQVTGVASPRFRLGRFLVDLAIGIAHAARRVAVYVVTMGLLLLVGVVVPVAGPVLATIGGAWATARFAAYDAHDSVWARRRWRYRDKLAYLRRHKARTLGLGAVVGAMLIVPGLNLVGLSIGATAATLKLAGDQAGCSSPNKTPTRSSMASNGSARISPEAARWMTT